MFGRLRHWAEAGAALLGLAFAVSAGPGYLPAVGPAPLRFRTDPPPATNVVKMPLPPPDPPPSTSAVATDTQTNAAPATPAAAAPSAAPVLLTATNSPVTPDAAPASSEPKISPEMLLKFFTPSTNRPSGEVIAPLDFAPPATAKPASSTATYSTQPK
jgi:hypothetical protein